MNSKIQIGIADDHKLLRQGIISLLSEYDHLKVVIDVNDGEELLEALRKSKPHVILLDIEMPRMNGKEALERILAKYPKIKVIMMSMHFNDAYIIEFIQNGAAGFLPKNCDIEKIVEAIESVKENGYYYDDKVSLAMANLLKCSPAVPSVVCTTDFSVREMQIMKLVYQKRTNTEISDILHISVRTIEGHRLKISKKSMTTSSNDLIEFMNKYRLL
jgi:two-component system response regulator DegU